MAATILRNPLALLRDKLQVARQERTIIDTEIDALGIEKMAINQMIVVVADKINEIESNIERYQDDETTYSEAIEEFEEAYGSILGLKKELEHRDDGKKQYDVILSGQKFRVSFKDNRSGLPTVKESEHDIPRPEDTLLSIDGDDLFEYESPYKAAMHLLNQMNPRRKPVTLRFESCADRRTPQPNHLRPPARGAERLLPGSKLAPKPRLHHPSRPMNMDSGMLPPPPPPPPPLVAERPLPGSKLAPKPRLQHPSRPMNMDSGMLPPPPPPPSAKQLQLPIPPPPPPPTALPPRP